MLGLVEHLPDIHEGAGKWIRALEEETMGKLLAVGDLKALLARLLGMARMEDVLMKSGLQAAVNTPYLDGASFDQFRPAMWRTLRVEAMPPPVRSRLEDVVGLNSKPHREFCDHGIHAVEKYRKDEQKLKDQEKETQWKLTQL
ncbi:hypothetical protein SKAU_G00174550 [Synaphobranchus kaupii]|uniref:Uncharacterized protein n=1 Tax=Synaphobranchus kaupii TaxID=118154 RepID=A0A9Q1J126_SYNKA|nr:hypothetical protein SKAU_G00174550 [Synaphobranchus kaupii]